MLSVLLAALPHLGRIAASVPEVAKLVESTISALSETDQPKAQKAYELSMSDARHAHEELQRLVAEHSG